jgi:hypothetical protein
VRSSKIGIVLFLLKDGSNCWVFELVELPYRIPLFPWRLQFLWWGNVLGLLIIGMSTASNCIMPLERFKSFSCVFFHIPEIVLAKVQRKQKFARTYSLKPPAHLFMDAVWDECLECHSDNVTLTLLSICIMLWILCMFRKKNFSFL